MSLRLFKSRLISKLGDQKPIFLKIAPKPVFASTSISVEVLFERSDFAIVFLFEAPLVIARAGQKVRKIVFKRKDCIQAKRQWLLHRGMTTFDAPRGL